MKETGKIKINCLIDSSGGSNITVKIPFSKLNGLSVLVDNIPHIIEVSFIEVELGRKRIEDFMLLNADILVTHWLTENSASEINLLCEKYNCLFFNTMDDFINENAYFFHPMYQDRKGQDGKIVKGSDICAHIKQRIILQAAISDLLIATTQPIVDQLSSYSDAIHLSPNYLPNENQYKHEK